MPINCRFFLNGFAVCFNLFVLLFLVTPCLVVAVQPCMEWISIKINWGFFHNFYRHYHHFNAIFITLNNSLKAIDKDILKLSDSFVTKVILHIDSKYNDAQNNDIVNSTITYSIGSKCFDFINYICFSSLLFIILTVSSKIFTPTKDQVKDHVPPFPFASHTEISQFVVPIFCGSPHWFIICKFSLYPKFSTYL